MKAGEDDIAIQVIDQFANGDVSVERERLVKEFDDPWHSIRLATAQAGRLLDDGRPGEAERLLRAALERCRPESMAASCWNSASMLGDLYVSVGRPSDARRVFTAAAPRLRAGGLPLHERKALVEVAALPPRRVRWALPRPASRRCSSANLAGARSGRGHTS